MNESIHKYFRVGTLQWMSFPDKASLMGPAPYAAKFGSEMRMTHNNFGLLVDCELCKKVTLNAIMDSKTS